METVAFNYGPKTLHLYMSGDAMFRIQALNTDEDKPDILDRILQNTVDGTVTLCQVAAILGEAGELCRRYLGYAKERIPTADELQQLLSPMQILGLRTTVVQAIGNGYEGIKEDSESGDIDLGLLELDKKTRL